MASKAKPKRVLTTGGMLLVLFFLLVSTVGLVGWHFYSTRSQGAKVEQEMRDAEVKKQRAEVEQKQGETEAKVVLARAKQAETLVTVHAATNAIGSLLAEVQRLQEQVAALKTNDLGRSMSVHPELVTKAAALFASVSKETPTVSETITKLENARVLDLEISEKANTAFAPTPDILLTADALVKWAEAQKPMVAGLQTAMTALTREARVKYTAPDRVQPAVPLVDAVEREFAERSAAIEARKAKEVREAKLDTMQGLADREVKKTVEKGNQSLEVVDFDNATDKLLHEQDMKKKETEREVALKAKRLEEEQSRKKIISMENRARAADPEIIAKLGPFVTPGYWQLDGKRSFDKQPHSLAALQNQGALERSEKGLHQLARVVFIGTDTERPRWRVGGGKNENALLKDAGWKERLKEAQELLIELGPALVEAGRLSP